MRIKYKNLLKKYIKHVATEEGVTFIDYLTENYGFSDKEIKVLIQLEKEIYDEWD